MVAKIGPRIALYLQFVVDDQLGYKLRLSERGYQSYIYISVSRPKNLRSRTCTQTT